MVNDLVADVLTRVRNAQRVGHKSVKVPTSRMTRGILDVLTKEGFIDGYDKVETGRGFSQYDVRLKYYAPYEPVISQARRVSKSGRRVYVGAEDLPKVAHGLGICIVSTSSGVVSDREARKLKVGGELLAFVS